jgi:Domain of unknown function (DUF5615)
VTVSFLADEDIDRAIVQGLRSREPAADVLDVKTSGLRGTADPTLLELAAQEGRILVTCDRRAMTNHFRKRVDAGKPTSGLLVVPQQGVALGQIIEYLLLLIGVGTA